MFRDGGGAKQIRKPGKSREGRSGGLPAGSRFWVWWLHLRLSVDCSAESETAPGVSLWSRRTDTASTAGNKFLV